MLPPDNGNLTQRTDTMNLTVIIPNYNGSRFLPACLESLKNQTYTDFEILLVDNGSTDDLSLIHI